MWTIKYVNFISMWCILKAETVKICPVQENLLARDMIFNYTCIPSAPCAQFKDPVFGKNIQKTVIVYSDKRSKVKTTNLVNNFSKCTKYQILIMTSSNVTSDRTLTTNCSSNLLHTLVIDVTNFQLENTFKDFQAVQDCWMYSLQENDGELHSIFKRCQSYLLINNITCDKNSYSPSIYEIDHDFKEILKNKTIRITPPKPRNSNPFVSSNGENNITNETLYSGFLFEMINVIAENLRFNYTIVPPIDGDFGSIVNGSWNGLVGMLERKETDIVLADLTVTYGRSLVIDFSVPYYNEPMGIMVQYSNIDKSLMRLINLFTPTVWALYLVSILVAIFTIWLLSKLTPLGVDSGTETLTASAWYVFAAQVNQQADRIVQSWSGRIFEVFWRFVAFLVIATYTGGFVADLTTSRINLPFKNLPDLVAAALRGEYKICIIKNDAFSTDVMANVSVSYQDLKKWLLANPKYYTSEDQCIKYLKEEINVALLAPMTHLDVLQKDGCQENKSLIILTEKFFPSYYTLGFQKNSPYNDIMSSQISNFVDSGLIDKWYKKYSKEMPFCKICEPDEILDGSSQGLTMTEIGGSFIVLAGGIVIGCFIFLYEIYKTHNHNADRKNDPQRNQNV